MRFSRLRRRKRRRWRVRRERSCFGEGNDSKFVDKQNYSSFSRRNNFLGIYPGDTRLCSYTGVWDSYDAFGACATADKRRNPSSPKASCYADDERYANLRDLYRGSLFETTLRRLTSTRIRRSPLCRLPASMNMRAFDTFGLDTRFRRR